MDDTITQLVADFENERGNFAKDAFPEARLIDILGDEQKVGYLSLFCTLDYNRGVDQLVDNIVELSDVDDGYGTDYFYPPSVIQVPRDEMQSVFTNIGFRYGNRDANGWYENCITITDTFGGSWEELHAASGYHAPTLVKLLREYDFKFIKGEKLAPFYARVVNDFISPLDDMWKLPIPVDTHIRRLSKDLFNDDSMSDDEIRERWRAVGQSYDVSPSIVDGAIWQVGYNWDDWGEQYWENL